MPAESLPENAQTARSDPASPGGPPPPDVPKSASQPAARKLLGVIVALLAVCGAIVVVVGFVFSGKVTTDDAQVDAHITTVSPHVPGYVARLFVNDNQPVKAGDPLLEIDPRDYQAAVDQAKAAYDAAVAQARTAKLDILLTKDTTASAVDSALATKAASEADLLRTRESFEETATAALKAAEANVRAKQATNVRAQADLARYSPLVKTDDVSSLQFDAVKAAARVAESELDLAEQQLDEARKAVDIARAQTATATAQLGRSEAQLHESHAQTEQVPVRTAQYHSSLAVVEQAKARLEEAKLQLGYTQIRAPIVGEVTEKNAQLGDYVTPGQLLLTIVPLQGVFVTANFKETQLAGVRPGQRAVIRADMYAGKRFRGVVDSIAGSTGSEQALLPPQNATGNFVKVVQRIPVKLRVLPDATGGAVLRSGMNVEVTIYVR